MNGAKVYDGLDRDDRLLGPPAALAQEAEHGFVLSQQLKWRCRKEIYLTSRGPQLSNLVTVRTGRNVNCHPLANQHDARDSGTHL